jgi:hypothetical protein
VGSWTKPGAAARTGGSTPREHHDRRGGRVALWEESRTQSRGRLASCIMHLYGLDYFVIVNIKDCDGEVAVGVDAVMSSV